VTSIEEYARDTVADQPDPPRQVGLWSLVSRSYASRTGRIVTAVGLVLGIPVTVAGFVAIGSLLEKTFLVAVAGVMILFVAGSPGIRGWRMWRALRFGEVAGGEIIRAAWQGPRLRPETVDAQEHGMAHGTWRVHHPTGDFEATFESDAPWASQLRKGAKVRVLVDPRRPRVLLDLGPAADPPEALRSTK
jgi:hypothetical protein